MGSHGSSSHSWAVFALSMAASASAGATLVWLWTKRTVSPETDYSVGHKLVWDNISGALNSAGMYVGDRLDIYRALREACHQPGSSVTAVELASQTGLNQRWLREWMAQQAAMGVLVLLPGTGDSDEQLRYRLPKATATVLADPNHIEYDIAMIQAVPSLVNRAKTMIPEAMRTGLGRSYDEPDVATAIDRAHSKHIRDHFIPNVLMKQTGIVKKLEQGCQVADLGCGAGTLSISLAKLFPRSHFHGFEISTVALEKASYNVASAKLKNVFLHDANQGGDSLTDFADTFDLALVFDVLHDATNPAELIRQVKASLKPEGAWLLADLPAKDSTRSNLKSMPLAHNYFGFSICLCMSCALSEPGGAGLGTLGFSVPVARQMLGAAGFTKIEVLSEKMNARWFLVESVQ